MTRIARMLVDLSDVPDRMSSRTRHEAEYRGRFSQAATRDAMARANGRHNLGIAVLGRRERLDRERPRLHA